MVISKRRLLRLCCPLLFHHMECLKHQLSFTVGMLGGPSAYSGRPLTPLHAALQIRPPQFARRQMILRESMEEFALDKAVADAWLAAEERLKALIMPDLFASCRD